MLVPDPIWLPLAVFFEAPLTAAAVAGGAVSIPIIIHLLNRKRFKVVTWAAMRFLLAAQKKNSRRMRLEQLLLLVLRCLVVLLLILAMASVTPWAEALWRWVAPNAAMAAGTGQRTHKVLVIDGSFSMGLKAGESTCFERARARAVEIVRGGAGRDGFSVVLMGTTGGVAQEPSEDATRVEQEIGRLRMTHGNADVEATLKTVEGMLGSSPGKFREKEVYFLTDLQQSTWLSPRPGTLSRVLHEIGSRARTVFVDVGRDGVDNVAVTRLAVVTPMPTAGRETLIEAGLTYYGEADRDVSVRLFVEAAGKKAERVQVQEQPVKLRRGEQTAVRFVYKFPAAGDYVLQVQAAHDDLEVDDLRSAVVTVKDRVKVMLVNGKPAVEFYDRAAGWLKTALNPGDDKSVPALPRIVSESQFADEGEGMGDLSDYDCVYLCDVSGVTPAEVRRLERHVRGGGGVVFCLGDRVDLGAYNELLYKDGQGLLPARLLGKQAAPEGYSYQLSVEPGAEREDPLKPFRDERARQRLVEPRFGQFVQCEPAPRGGPRRILSFSPVAVPGKKPASKAPPPGGPAMLEWNPPAGKEAGRRMRGRVVLITAPVNSDWSNWPASPSFLPLMQELLGYAAAGKVREQAVQVGDPLELFLVKTEVGKEVRVRTPDGREDTIQTQDADGAVVARWPETSISGVYRFSVGQDRAYHFAVNPPAVSDAQQSESNLARTDREELQKTYPEWDLQVVTDPGQVVRKAGTASGGTEMVQQPIGPEVAHRLLLVLLVLVLLEVVLAWQFGHYSAAVNAAETAGGVRAPRRWAWVLVVLPWVLFTVLLGMGAVLLHDAWTGDFLGFMPDGMRRGVERVLHIPPPAPGEGSHWRLEYGSYFWDLRSDVWLAGALAVGALAMVVMIYRREAAAARATRRGSVLVLAGLRLGLLMLMLVVLLPQLKLWFERQGWPDVVILIDDSMSMSTHDDYRDPRIKEVAEKLAVQGEMPQGRRLQLAQALVARSQPDWLTALLTRKRVRLHVYHCSSAAGRVADVNGPEDVKGALEKVRGLKTEKDSSQLGKAVRQVLSEFRGSSLTVVMLTDGITTEGEDLVKAAKYAGQVGVPLYFVGIGDAQEVPNLYLHDLQVNDNVYVHDRLVFEVQLTSQGFQDLPVKVTLREKGSDKVLDEKSVRVEGLKKKTEKVILTHQPDKPGEKFYEITVPVQAGEVDKDDNRLERQVYVREDKRIKVLYVEGYRRYEYHYVKTLLERENSRVKGNKSFELQVLLLNADPEYATEDRSAISEFPSKKALEGYDVIILGDVNPRPEDDPKMTEHLKDVADFVREHGGGLLMIAGERYAPRAYKDSPLKDVLPIDVTDGGGEKGQEDAITEGYHLELTPFGRSHPMFWFNKTDEKERDELWKNLKDMYWYAGGYEPKRAAEALAVHPTLRAGKKKGGGLDGHPLVLQQFVGAGRSMFFGFNETWRWGFRENQAHFNEFWIQAMRYLARGRSNRVTLTLNQQAPYRRGEKIEMTVKFPDDAPPPADDTKVKVVVERRAPGRAGDTEVRTVKLEKRPGSRATYEGTLTQTPEGEYKFWLREPSVSGPKPRAECRVLAPPGEMDRLQTNEEGMVQAAEQSGGKYYSLADAGRLVDEVRTGTRVTINGSGPPWLVWNNFALFVLALLLLTTEWLLRKQKNLL